MTKQGAFRLILVASGMVLIGMVGFLGLSLRQRATERQVVQLEDQRRIARMTEAVLQELLSDAGVEGLLTQHPGLVPLNRQTTFRQQAQAWRPRLQALLLQGVEASSLRRQFRQRSGGLERIIVDWPDHARLDVIWHQGQLHALFLGMH